MEFYERKTVNLKEGTDEAIKKFIKNNPDLYSNPSHFIRSAIIAFFRSHRKRGNYINEPRRNYEHNENE